VREVTYLQEKAEGLASAFIYGGARACIGALWPIHDDAAAQFAIEFYRSALDGQTVGEALRLARGEIKERFPDRITWAAFVLYGDPTARLPSVAE
jgi:CHAT domain-containing protein